MSENQELNMEQLDEVAGGYKRPPEKAGFIIYQIKKGDTLIKIANKYGISDWRVIRKWNPHINPETNMIRTGEYLWIKK